MESFICQHCKKSFANKYTLSTHIKTAKSCIKLQKQLANQEHEFICNFCYKKYTTKNTLLVHVESCKTFLKKELDRYQETLISRDTDLKNKNSRLTDIHNELKIKNHQIKTQNREIKHKDQEIAKLREELAFQKGQYAGYKNVKPANIITTNTQYINPRLKDVPVENIEPFVQRTIDSHLSTYTYSHYKDHRRGVVEHLLSITTFRDSNDILNKSLACTNRSMNTFYALLEDKKWTKDLAVESIHKYLDSLRPLVEIYWPKFQKDQYADINEGDSDKILMNSKIYAKLLSFNPGVLEHHSHGFRKELVERIQAKIRNTLSV